jgi:hypothetical protein
MIASDIAGTSLQTLPHRGSLDSLALTVVFINGTLLFTMLLMVREWVPAGWQRRRATVLCAVALTATVAGGSSIFQQALETRRHCGDTPSAAAPPSSAVNGEGRPSRQGDRRRLPSPPSG